MKEGMYFPKKIKKEQVQEITDTAADKQEFLLNTAGNNEYKYKASVEDQNYNNTYQTTLMNKNFTGDVKEKTLPGGEKVKHLYGDPLSAKIEEYKSHQKIQDKLLEKEEKIWVEIEKIMQYLSTAPKISSEERKLSCDKMEELEEEKERLNTLIRIGFDSSQN